MKQEKNYTGLIPENTSGKEITAEATAIMANADEARALYAIARERLLLVNNWGEVAGALSSEFALTDERGNTVDRHAQTGDHFRINITGPGNIAGDGYDWAHVEAVEEVNEGEVDSVAIQVRPTDNPQNDDSSIAHFYDKKSTSTFIVTREDNAVTASVYDRNIEANTDTKSLVDKVRDVVVGVSAKHGLSRVQWESFVHGLIKHN